MGTQCCSTSQRHNIQNLLQYGFGEDEHQNNVEHSDSLQTIDEGVNYYLQDCQQRLKKSLKLYKDPSVQSKPLVLKSSQQQRGFQCQFRRPYCFLRDKQIIKTKMYKILEQEKTSNYSQIVINNSALQYFAVFLCFLADNSYLLKSIILTNQNTYGIQVIYMYVNGIKTPIYMDDYILCYNQKPVFSQPVNNIYMWPCLLEKAWLKLKGYGSKNISTTSPLQVFQHFLLYPFETYNLNMIGEGQYESIRIKVQRLCANDCCIVGSKKQPTFKIGLSGRKHFYLKTVFEYKNKVYYYLRNPCGFFDFRGQNSHLSEQLKEKIKQETGETIVAEGNFILQQEQFQQQIQQVLIVRYNVHSNIINQYPVELKHNEEFYAQIELTKNESVSISFLQGQIEGGDYSQITYQVLRQDQGVYEIVSGQQNEEGCFGLRSTSLFSNVYQKLEKGSYLIRLKKKSQSNKGIKDKIIITASQHIQIKTGLSQIYRNKFTQFLKSKGLQAIKKEGRKKGQEIEYHSIWIGDLVYIYIRKVNKQQQEIKLQVSFSQRLNLQCISHPINSEFAMIPLVEDDLLIIFEKINLVEETKLGKYSIETF